MQAGIFCEFGQRHLLIDRGKGPFGEGDLGGVDLQVRCGVLRQHADHRRRGGANLWDVGRGGAATGGSAVVWHEGRIGHDHADLVQRHPQFFGGGLTQLSAATLPYLDLAGEQRDHAILADVESIAQRFIPSGGSPPAPLLGGGPIGVAVAGDRDHKPGPQGLHELAPPIMKPIPAWLVELVPFDFKVFGNINQRLIGHDWGLLWIVDF